MNKWFKTKMINSIKSAQSLQGLLFFCYLFLIALCCYTCFKGSLDHYVVIPYINKEISLLTIWMMLLIILFSVAFFTIDLKRINIKKSIVFFIIILIVIRTIDYGLLSRLQTNITEISFQESDNYDKLSPGEITEYTFSSLRSPFTRTQFFLKEYEHDTLQAELVFAETGETLFSKQIEEGDVVIGEVPNDVAVNLFLSEPIPKGNYILRLSNLGKDDVSISLTNEMAINLVVDHTTYMAYQIALIVMFISGLMLIIFIGCISKTKDIAKCYLGLVIPLGIIYLILFLPWSQPDTNVHYMATYRLSNMVMGYTGDLEWHGRQDDIDFYKYNWGVEMNPSLMGYSGVLRNIELACEHSEMADHPLHADHMKYYSIIGYLPQVLGLSIGRLLNLGTVLCIYLSRIFILIFYIATTYRAIKRAPSGKSILFMTCLLPMSLMMSSAISYDPMVSISTVSFISSILYLYHNTESKAALIETCVWIFIIGAVKGGGYLILLPLILVLLRKNNIKQCAKQMLSIAIAGVASVVLFDKILTIHQKLFQFGGEADKLYAGYVFENPLRVLDMSIEIYTKELDVVVLNMGGTHLAWLESVVPAFVIVCLVAFGCVYAMFEQDSLKLEFKDKYIMLTIIIIGIVTTPIMLLSYTDINANHIIGLQGRYYLPLLPLAIIILTKFSTHRPIVSEDDDAMKIKMLNMFSVISVIVIYYMCRLYLTR